MSQDGPFWGWRTFGLRKSKFLGKLLRVKWLYSTIAQLVSGLAWTDGRTETTFCDVSSLQSWCRSDGSILRFYNVWDDQLAPTFQRNVGACTLYVIHMLDNSYSGSVLSYTILITGRSESDKDALFMICGRHGGNNKYNRLNPSALSSPKPSFPFMFSEWRFYPMHVEFPHISVSLTLSPW